MSTQMFRVYIKATPENGLGSHRLAGVERPLRLQVQVRVRTQRAAARTARSPTRRCAGSALPEVVIDGEVKEADPPKKLVHTFHALFSPEQTAEPGIVVTYLLEPEADGTLTRLTLVTEENNSPVTLAMVMGGDGELADGGGGFPFVLSDLKSLLESGSSLQSA